MVKLIKKLFARTPSTLAQILATESAREELLGMKLTPPPNTDQILQDASKLVGYSHSTDYKVWCKEAWSKVLAHMDALQNSKASPSEIDFHRGALKATLDLLRVSDQARAVKTALEQETQANVSSAR